MKGIGVSPGISIGTARVIRKTAAALTGILLTNESAIPTEIKKYDEAVGAAVKEIEGIIARGAASLPPESIEILEMQIELSGDPQIKDNVVQRIISDKKNVSDAFIEVIRDTVEIFSNMEDEYMSARAADIQDIGDRILQHLQEARATTAAASQPDPLAFGPDTILIADDFTPTDTITMDTSQVIGFATRAGSRTSHVAIIASARGIPAVVGCGDELLLISNGDKIILDSLNGLVLVNPDMDTLAQYRLKKLAYAQQTDRLAGLKEVAARTTDGEVITLLANIGEPDDLDQVFEKGGQGTGLLRTELLFMGRSSFPTEEEQFEFYKEIALRSGDKPVIIRTLDIGGDKQLPYFGLPPEQNPFLGYRAIRICLDREELFITQLKAILRAAAFGNVKIMFPMIGNIRELRSAKQVLAKAKTALSREKRTFAENIAVGIMIEIPSAAIIADWLAKEADFFSIGTNDLCQYTLAVDRMNEKVKDLYDPYDPGVLRLVHNVIEQGCKNNIPVAMCGELASDPLATLLLLGMGLREFSMSAPSIPFIKNIINHNSIVKAKEVCKKVMEMNNSKDIITYLQEVQP
ncbi:MAG TPA: phosphoenolpyruvate--protein phosphotransferase [Puia sp.]|nr:phosphoenolpyruvate--protein phosphotransferase [Puia sp.]